MPRVRIGGQPGSVSDTTSRGGKGVRWEGFVEQLNAMASAMRQLIGNANILEGNSGSTDPLNGPFELYFDWDRGTDIFVAGEYNSFESSGTDEERIAAKINRMSMQQLTAGYTKARPFKTLLRARIEAAIITSRNYYTYSDPRAHRDCVIIHPAPGPQPLHNHPGSHEDALPITEWEDGFIPTWQHLIAFNDDAIGSILLPRGASMPGAELRKCNMIPQWAPPDEEYAADYSNVRTVISLTPDNHTTDFSFRDPPGTGSLHLLYGIGYASEQELDQFYEKTFQAVGSSANLSEALTTARRSEYEVVGPIEGAPSLAWDTVKGSSAYPERISLRSERGMGGLFINGEKLQGLKSTVTAQYTGTCLQTVLTSWQIYSEGNWITPPSYEALIAAQPDDRRMNPRKWSHHILAINGAFVSDVSVFGIGQGVKSLADSGADITSTNGNFAFGSCAGLARGYKPVAFPQDKNWQLSRIKAPLSPGDRTPNVRSISLGRVAAVTSSTITLIAELDASEVATNPAILAQDGYSLAAGSYVWVDNPQGPDYRAVLTSSAWNSSNAATINISAALVQSDTDGPVPIQEGVSFAVGKRVYIRRLIDNRSTAQRRVALELNNTGDCRMPIRSQVMQLDPTVFGGQVTRELAPGGAEVLQVTQVGSGTVFGPSVTRTASITLRRSAASINYASDTYFRKGTVVKAMNKHWIALKDLISEGLTPDPALWGETFVHMPEQYNAPDNADNEAPSLVFDVDTDPANVTTTCGINWSTIFTAAGSVRERFRTGVDALGAYAFLRAMGFSDAAAWAALTPRVEADRLLDPSSATDFPTAPSGGAAAGRGNWAVEFRRSSTVALLTHTWDLGAGRGNYSTGLLAAQKTMSPQNLFSLLFTNEAGGRMIVSGTNEDGLRVSPRGLEDNETGELTNPIDIGSPDANPPTALNNLSVDNLTITGELDLSGVGEIEGAESVSMRTDRYGLGGLASISDLVSLSRGVGTDNEIDNSSDKLLTLPALNRLFIERRVLTNTTGSLVICVRPGAADRILTSMFNVPPDNFETAIPTLSRAAEYANAVLAGGGRRAEIRIAPGLYNPSSTWRCNVTFASYNADLTAMPFPSTSAGTGNGVDAVANNHFDGSGYEDFANRVHFQPYRLSLRPSINSGNMVNLACQHNEMSFHRGVDFVGGIHCLGLAETIKAVANGLIPISSFFSGGVIDPVDFTTDTTNNVDTLISAIRSRNERLPAFDTWTNNAFITILSATDDVVFIRNLLIGPGLPSRKAILGGERNPLIASSGSNVLIQLANIYIRGKTRITSAGMGVTSSLPRANTSHLGTTEIPTPWVWEQTFHTFIGSDPNAVRTLNLQFGDEWRHEMFPSSSRLGPWNTFQDGTGKILPNSIHLLTNAGVPSSDVTAGPFFDQFIHAPGGISIVRSWRIIAETTSEALRPVFMGFFGKFGANGYNATLTRGILGGNSGRYGGDTPEVGFRASITGTNPPPNVNYRTIFRVAGLAPNTLASLATPVYVSNGQAFGEAGPAGSAGFNPVITTDTSAPDGLNLGLRSYRQGISPEYGNTIAESDMVL